MRVMPDHVWPAARPRPTASRNGFGRELMGFTRPDESGGRFATCWVVAFGLPIVPVARCYISEERTHTHLGSTHIPDGSPPAGDGHARAGGHVTRVRGGRRYRIEGESRRRVPEILRTYAFCWILVPAVVVAPVLVLLSQADRFVDTASEDGAGVGAKLALVAALLLVMTTSILVLSAALALYRSRWAPIRTAEWIDRPDAGAATDATTSEAG